MPCCSRNAIIILTACDSPTQNSGRKTITAVAIFWGQRVGMGLGVGADALLWGLKFEGVLEGEGGLRRSIKEGGRELHVQNAE